MPPFAAFYIALFAGYGVASPFLPALLQHDGLSASQLGLVLAAGAGVRLLAGPAGARLADRTGRHAVVLSGFAALSAVVALGYAPARNLWPLLAVVVLHAVVLAPLTPIADALALDASERGAFRYGWVRGIGSAAFIAAVLASGQWVGHAGPGVIVWLNAGLLACAAALGWRLPGSIRRGAERDGAAASAWSLLRIRPFVLLMAAAALVGGSHAMHDGFEVIRWTDAGLSARQSSVLWSLSVAAEVLVFLLAGPPLLARLGPAWSIALSACAGVVRWGTAAQTAWFPAMALVEPLHGLTFALLHLACMDMIGRVVPKALAATAQAFYANVALGAATAALTAASGPLYARLGPPAFWAMAALCALALPVAGALRALPELSAPAGRGRDERPMSSA